MHDLRVSGEMVRAVCLGVYPHARIEAIPNSGHDPVQEVRIWLTRRIEDSLRDAWQGQWWPTNPRSFF